MGTDTYDLSATTAAAVVNLVTGKATSGAGTDTLSGIENVLGGAGNDTITGDANDNVVTGNGGADTVAGGLGNDTFVATAGDGNDRYDGGGGTDTYDASAITTAVTINLNQSKATGVDIGTDVVLNMENAIGGAGNDLVVGNALGNVLVGGAGNDQLNGNGRRRHHVGRCRQRHLQRRQRRRRGERGSGPGQRPGPGHRQLHSDCRLGDRDPAVAVGCRPDAHRQ